MKNWYALHTKPRKEQQVYSLLAQRGIESFLPLSRLLKKGRLIQTREPLFPCYIFASMDLTVTSVSDVNWTEGLRSIVSFCGEPATIEPAIIDHIRQRLSDGKGPEIYGKFKPGDKVTLRAGPFRDLDAIFDSNLSGSGRVRILLSVLGHETPCEVAVDWLERST